MSAAPPGATPPHLDGKTGAGPARAATPRSPQGAKQPRQRLFTSPSPTAASRPQKAADADEQPQKVAPGPEAARQADAADGEVRLELGRERERSRLLERRAEEAEAIAVWLKRELDRSWKEARTDQPDGARARSTGAGGASAVRARREVGVLTEQNLQLRGELNQEKQKVIDLRRDAMAHTEELDKACVGRDTHQRLREELARVRAENVQLCNTLCWASHREEDFKREIAALAAKQVEPTNAGVGVQPEEAEAMVKTMSLRLFEVEQELAQHARERSELVEPALSSALGILARVCAACRKLHAAADRQHEMPPARQPEPRGTRGKLAGLISSLQYVLGVVDPRGEVTAMDALPFASRNQNA